MQVTVKRAEKFSLLTFSKEHIVKLVDSGEFFYHSNIARDRTRLIHNLFFMTNPVCFFLLQFFFSVLKNLS